MSSHKRNIWKNWDIVHAFLTTIGFSLFLFFDRIMPIVIFSLLSFSYFIFTSSAVFRDIKPFGGYANWVTIFRLVLLLLIGVFYINYSHTVIVSIAVFALSLDGLDGFLARRFGITSDFGAVLDGESDAFFVLLFSVIIYKLGYVDGWILWVGMLRYLYVLVCYTLWREVLDESVSYYRKTMAVVTMAAILSPFVMPQQYYAPILMVSTVAITMSFLKSFIFQVRSHSY